MGVDPVVVDDRPGEVGDIEVVATDAGGLEALAAVDVVVKTPGLSRYRDDVAQLEAKGIPVVGGLGLWLAEADLSRVACVTGTKGKSTTVTILAHLATGLGRRVFAGGNLGSPPYDPAVSDDYDLFVIETSSYQAADVAVSPPVVAVTSLHPDHIPWHVTVENYYRDKLSLCTQPGARTTVAAGTDAGLRSRADQLGPDVQWVDPDTWGRTWAADLGLKGTHNLVNAGIARSCLVALGIDEAAEPNIAEVCGGFEHLESRLEPVATVDGVDFVDDSLSTNVLSTLAAVEAFPGRPVVLIAGGLDRGIDFEELAEGLAERNTPTLVLTAYQTGPAIHEAMVRHATPNLTSVACESLDEAMEVAWPWAKERTAVVLLSPAAASFDAFDDYRHRARVFREAVARVSR